MTGYQVHAMRIAASVFLGPDGGHGPFSFQVQARRMAPPSGVRVLCMASPFQPQVMRMVQLLLARMPVLLCWLAGWVAGRCRVC